jgi:hypothetical protein
MTTIPAMLNVQLNHQYPDQTCCDAQPCGALFQAFQKEWIIGSCPHATTIDGKDIRFVAVGGYNENHISVFNYCPFCGVNLRALEGYVSADSDKTTTHLWKPGSRGTQ